MIPAWKMLGIIAAYFFIATHQIAAGQDCQSIGLPCNGVFSGCCTEKNPCKEGDGDCNNSKQCEGSLVCGDNNCPWGDGDDCCIKDPSEGLRCGGVDDGCCTKENPCKEGDGDCDADNHCEGSLVCLDNSCPWGDGDDCCNNPAPEKRPKIDVVYSPKMKSIYRSCRENDGCDGCSTIIKGYLPILLENNKIKAGEVGVASAVIHDDKYPLALLKGKDIILEKTKNEAVTINGTVNGIVGGKRDYSGTRRRPTGLYAAPGDIVTITIPKQLVGKLKVHIGHNIFGINNGNYRMSYLLKKVVGKIASPWGGPIIVEMTEKDAIKGEFTVKLDHATKAPAFVYGKDTNELWNTKIKKYAPKWTVLRLPGQLDLYVQTLRIKYNITDMEGTLSNIKKTMDILEDMLGLPPNSQPGPDILVIQPGTNRGGLRWGVCKPGTAMAGDMPFTEPPNKNDADYHYFDDLFSFSKDPLKGSGINPVTLHELGHGWCYGDLPGMGAQWTAETVQRYVEYNRGMGTGYKTETEGWSMDSPDMNFHLLYRMVAFALYNLDEKPCGDPLLKFSGKQPPSGSYDNCQKWLNYIPNRVLGWHLLKNVFTLDAKSKKSYTSENDRMVDLYCQASKYNLLPFFNWYNIKPSETTVKECQKLPQSTLIKGWIKIVNCVKKSMDSNESQDIRVCAKLPGFPAHKGLCVLSGECQNDEPYGGKTTVMKNKFDLFGMTKLLQNKEKCFKRAENYFKDCKNDVTQKKQNIIATFYSNDSIKKYSFTYPSGFSEPANACIWGHTDKTLYNVDLDACKLKCSSTTDYKSLEYSPSRKTCWLSKSTRLTAPKSAWQAPCSGSYADLIFLEKGKLVPLDNCYNDWPRLLPDYKGSSSDMTPAVCQEKCKEKYAYSGVQNYKECWCGNNAPPLDKKVNMEKCDRMCSGDKNQRCGGGYKNNILKV